jgi:hypothetical protein
LAGAGGEKAGGFALVGYWQLAGRSIFGTRWHIKARSDVARG